MFDPNQQYNTSNTTTDGQYDIPQEQMESGLRQVAEIGFNQDIQNILLSRIQQVLTPEEAKILDSVVNPQTVKVFIKLLPELKPVFDIMSGSGDAQPIQGPAGVDVQQVPDSMGNQKEPLDDVGEYDEEDEGDDNPLLRNGVASRGLVG